MEQDVGTVAKRYSQLEGERDTFLERGREAARLTIPTLLPDEGHSSSSIYATPYQGIGARGVNNLASKLLLALLPPNSPFFRLTIDDFDLQQIAGDNRGQVEEGLARIERAAMAEIEGKAVRVPTFEALKLLIVTGNALVYMPKEGGMKVYRPDRYVVKRDAMGNTLEIITKESMSPLVLPEEIKAQIPPSDTPAKSYDLYTRLTRVKTGFEVIQEVAGIIVESSRGKFKADSNPFIPLRFIRIDGEDYGRGFIEEYIGDLRSLEALTKAIVQGSAASAKVLFLVRPNGTTKTKDLSAAPNGAFLQGDSNDVSTLQVQKAADFRVSLETMRMINDRLSAAFLLNSSVQRAAERVTAEEVRFMAQELETTLGGVYSILSQEFQLPLINLLLESLTKQGKMPKMPKDSVKPTVVTGIEALGRGQDLNKLASFLQYLQPLGPEVIQSEMNLNDYIDRLAASLGIDTSGLIKSQEQKMQEQMMQQQAMQEQMLEQGAMGVAQKAAPAVAGAIDPEQVQQAMEQMSNG
jgi:hypothetical protein